MSGIERTGHFWDIIAGRAEPPSAAKLLDWMFVRVDDEAQRLYCRFTATDEMLNPAGTVQGGFLAAMLDEATGPAAAALLGGRFVSQTLEMKVNYLRPARVGPIYGEGGIVQRGRTILFLEGCLKDADGRLLATASLTARVVPMASE